MSVSITIGDETWGPFEATDDTERTVKTATPELKTYELAHCKARTTLDGCESAAELLEGIAAFIRSQGTGMREPSLLGLNIDYSVDNCCYGATFILEYL